MLTLECGISPDYVLDRMQMYEVSPLLENLYRKNKENWEQTRLICYLTAQVNSSKKLDPQDILRFNWEENNVKKDVEVSSEERERLMSKANNYIKYIQEDGFSNKATT